MNGIKHFFGIIAGLLIVGTDAQGAFCENFWNGEPRFVEYSQGTVLDRKTSLVWLRCSVGQAWDGKTCIESKEWQVFSWFSWDEAQKEVARWQNRDGFQNYRLPSIKELMTLADSTCEEVAINQNIFPNTKPAYFWSKSEFSENKDYAWVMNFRNGEYGNHLKSIPTHHIRLVMSLEE